MIGAITEPGQGSLLGALIALAMTHDFLKLRCQQSTDGAAFLSGDDSDFSQDFGVNFEGNIGLHNWHVSACCTIMRAIILFVDGDVYPHPQVQQACFEHTNGK